MDIWLVCSVAWTQGMYCKNVWNVLFPTPWTDMRPCDRVSLSACETNQNMLMCWLDLSDDENSNRSTSSELLDPYSDPCCAASDAVLLMRSLFYWVCSRSSHCSAVHWTTLAESRSGPFQSFVQVWNNLKKKWKSVCLSVYLSISIADV